MATASLVACGSTRPDGLFTDADAGGSDATVGEDASLDASPSATDPSDAPTNPTDGAPEACDANGRCVCAPSCAGRQCGPDGCGGSCGPCAQPSACTSDGQCVCTPSCSGRECGPDGCGGSCGTCRSGSACDASGRCACVPNCSGKQCGTDGCGGTCGGACDYLLGEQCNGNGQCACNQTTCPVPLPVPGGTDTACQPAEGSSTCTYCPPSCGPRYLWACVHDLPPPGLDCTHVGAQTYCCTARTCVSAPDFRANCHNVGLPEGSAFTCWDPAVPQQPGCQRYSNTTIYCCP